MILAIHIALAFISIAFVSHTALSPSKNKLRITYFLTLGAVLSSLVMLLIRPAHLGQACVSGTIYLVFMGVVSTIARKRLPVVSPDM